MTCFCCVFIFIFFLSQGSLTPCFISFLQHTRHGFSSNGLLALNFEIEDENIQQKNNTRNCSNSKCSWANQDSLLTYILSSLIEQSNDFPLMCHFPLASYCEKIHQLKQVQALIWQNFHQVASIKRTFRYFFF